jgi:hypothetical protein
MTTSFNHETLSQQLRELEESLLVPHVRKSERLAELLADNFLEFGSSGRIYTKADLVATLQAELPVTQTTSEFRVAILAPHVALVTYRIHRHGAPPIYTLRSSIWQLKEAQWQMVFHQATLTPTPQ